MGRVYDPNNEEYDKKGQKTPDCVEGTKLLAAVGFERYTSSNGNRCLSVGFVCLQDLSKRGDEKHRYIENFVLEDSSMFRFMQFCRAVGWKEPIDVDEDSCIEDILSNGYVEASLTNETYQGKTRARAQEYKPARDGDDDPAWAAWIEDGEENWREYLKWRADNPRGSGGGGGRRGGRRGGGGGNRDEYSDRGGGDPGDHERDHQGGGQRSNEDIPF